MQRYPLLWLLILAASLIGCQNNETPTPPPDDQGTTLTIDYPTFLYAQPDAQTPGLALPKGAQVQYQGRISDHVTTIAIQDTTYQDPWLYVQTSNGQRGWLFAGFIKVDDVTDTLQLARLKVERRLAQFFGERHLPAIAHYTTTYDSCRTASDFAAMLMRGQQLRDTLNVRLNQYALQASRPLQDLIWMQQPLPAFVPTRIPQSDYLHLFLDFKVLQRRAIRTTGAADDSLIQAFLYIYSSDSIEYYYPSWTIIDGDISRNFSLLGEGLHYRILYTLSQAQLLGGEDYRALVQPLKRHVLNDIVASTQYWYDTTRVIAEIKRIQNDANLTALNPDDRVALQARIPMLQQPGPHGISLNWRERL